MLKPGLNSIDVADWSEAKKQRMTQVHLEQGIFIEMKEVDSLRQLSPPEALKMIELSVDKPMLHEWRREDKRTVVAKALSARLEVLETPEPGTTKSKLKD